MTTPPDDAPDLRRAFAELRASDAASAPPYEQVRARVSRRRPRLAPWPALVVAGALAAAVISGLAVRRRPEPTPLPAAPSFEAWTAPTDFLLATPGREIVETVPAIGAGARSLP